MSVGGQPIMTEGGTVSSRSPGRWHVRGIVALSRSFVAAFTVATGALLVVGWLTFVSVPPVQLTLEPRTNGEWVVADVPVAEFAWLSGVRPGMTAGGFVAPGPEPGRDWTSLFVTDGVMTIDVQRHPIPPDPVTFTVGAVALLLAAIAWRLAPTLAWWLLAVPPLASLAVASDLVPASIALALTIAPPAVAATCAADRARRLHWIVPVVAGLAVLLDGAVWLLAYQLRFDSWAAPRDFSGAVAVALLGLGTAGVVRQAAWRARARLTRAGAEHAGGSVLVAATIDELIPGRAHSRLQAIERERASLAADLHAEVLPDLAAVIRSVDAGLDPTEAVARLRAVADELRELMSERRLSVLDELGLLPALEWLAERIEERTNVTVEIEVRGEDVARAPREVELAAYRIAQQAIDNALVHGRPTRIQLRIEIAGDRLALQVTDDGTGITADADRRALRAGRLGLADMRARAAAISGSFRIWRRPEGGTTAELRWPA